MWGGTGFAYGAFQSYARAFYAEFIPPGEEARWYVSVLSLFLCRRHVVDVERRYGLFSITDKVTFYSVAFLSLLTAILQKKKRKRKRQSSSFVGPLIVGLIADSTGNIRYAFFFLVVMIWLAVPVLLSVDVERGRVDAQTYSVAREEMGMEASHVEQ